MPNSLPTKLYIISANHLNPESAVSSHMREIRGHMSDLSQLGKQTLTAHYLQLTERQAPTATDCPYSDPLLTFGKSKGLDAVASQIKRDGLGLVVLNPDDHEHGEAIFRGAVGGCAAYLLKAVYPQIGQYLSDRYPVPVLQSLVPEGEDMNVAQRVAVNYAVSLRGLSHLGSTLIQSLPAEYGLRLSGGNL